MALATNCAPSVLFRCYIHRVIGALLLDLFFFFFSESTVSVCSPTSFVDFCWGSTMLLTVDGCCIVVFGGHVTERGKVVMCDGLACVQEEFFKVALGPVIVELSI